MIGDTVMALLSKLEGASGMRDEIERVRIELNRLQGLVPLERERLVLVEEKTASASATLDFVLPRIYRRHIFIVNNLKPATDAAELWLRMSTDNGVTFIATNTYRYLTRYAIDDGVTLSHVASAGDAKIRLSLNTGNAADESQSGRVELQNPASSVNQKLVEFAFSVMNSLAQVVHYDGSGANTTATAVNAARFLYSSGNIASGTIALYGIT